MYVLRGLFAGCFVCSFLLDLAPRGQASSVSFFQTAALQFVLTISTCALYLVDSKLRLMGDRQM